LINTMPSVVYCRDSSKARSERERSYNIHIEYLRTLKSRIRFAGPLATADDARPQGDGNLVGSLFVIDEPPSLAFKLMQGDPYVSSGVWDGVSVFQAVKEYGCWPLGVPLLKPPRRFYAALTHVAGPPLVVASAVLFGAELQPREILPAQVGSASWHAVAIFCAESLDEARSMLVREAEYQTRQISCWSLPIAVGSWIQPPQPT
jgi:uncharacterized protein YciI